MDHWEIVAQLAQLAILISAFTTPHVLASPTHKVRRWGYIMSIIVQPAWWYMGVTAWMDGTATWGLLGANVSHTLAACIGIYKHWFKRRAEIETLTEEQEVLDARADFMSEVEPEEGYCSEREDETHCVHWWDQSGPCCACGLSEDVV